MTRRSIAPATSQAVTNRIDLYPLGGVWTAVYTGPHAFEVMEHSPDGTCCLETPFPAARDPDEVIAWLRTRTARETVITAER